jgi:hypothetical protein
LTVLLGAGQARAANLPSNCTQSGTTVTCTFSPGPEGTFAVPAGVASVHVVATGQGGGAPNIRGSGVGGPGAQVTADLGVRAGSTLFVEVAIGGGASASTAGARGGGESDVRTCSITDASCPAVGTAQDPRLIVAGGGGGGGVGFGGGCCTKGGDGGAGGVGTNTCNPGTDGTAAAVSGQGGKGGGCTSGGAGGSGFGPGGDGTASSGGSGGFGGGGGAGFFGGGGGGSGVPESGGGGGGSSFGPTGSVFARATTEPQVVITYTARPTVVLTVQVDCSQSGKFCFDFSATTTDIPAAGRSVVVTVFGIQQNGQAQALGGSQNVHFGENVVDHTFAYCFPLPAGVTFTRFQVQVKLVESDLSVTLNGSSDLHIIPPSAGGGVAVLASLDNTCAPPASTSLAPTGGFDFRLPLIGLTVIVAGLALYLVSAGRGRPSKGR